MLLLFDSKLNSDLKQFNGIRANKETTAEENSIVDDHCSHLPVKFSVNVKDRQDKLPRYIGYPSFINP